jgi:hypothetical protein
VSASTASTAQATNTDSARPSSVPDTPRVWRPGGAPGPGYFQTRT